MFFKQFFLSNTVRNVELSNFPIRVTQLSSKYAITLSTRKNCVSRFSIIIISGSKTRLRQLFMVVYRLMNAVRNFLSTATPSFSRGFGCYDFGCYDFGNSPRPTRTCLPRFIVCTPRRRPFFFMRNIIHLYFHKFSNSILSHFRASDPITDFVI